MTKTTTRGRCCAKAPHALLRPLPVIPPETPKRSKPGRGPHSATDTAGDAVPAELTV